MWGSKKFAELRGLVKEKAGNTALSYVITRRAMWEHIT
jgi:hypothetical protein